MTCRLAKKKLRWLEDRKKRHSKAHSKLVRSHLVMFCSGQYWGHRRSNFQKMVVFVAFDFITSGHVSGLESTSIYGRKVGMSGRPAVITPLKKLMSLERHNQFTSTSLCPMSTFNTILIWPTPMPTGVCHGTWRAEWEGLGDTLSLGNSTTTGPKAFKFGVCLETNWSLNVKEAFSYFCTSQR